MADISLTKIYTGMEGGPEQIDSNFSVAGEAINTTADQASSLIASSELLWSKGVTNGDIFQNGFVRFARHGSIVTVNGLFSTTKAFAKGDVIGQIDAGYKPIDGQAYVQTSLGIATIDAQGLHAPAAIAVGGYLTVGGSYATDDDLPE